MNKIEELEKRLEILERLLGVKEGAPVFPAFPQNGMNFGRSRDCGCAPNQPCGSTICPRMKYITANGRPV